MWSDPNSVEFSMQTRPFFRESTMFTRQAIKNIEKTLGLFRVRDYTPQLYGDYKKPLSGSL